MASTDARPIPRKNTAFRAYFTILDADGDPVSGATALDSEVSIDGGNFADCTSEATEIQSTGMYYLDLTAAEMNGDGIVVQVKTTSTGAKTTVLVFYPEESGDVRVNVDSISSDAINAAAIAADAIGSSELAATAASEIATAVRTELATELARIDAAVTTRMASGATVDLAATGLDGVTVESGLNARQALAIMASALAGVLSGAATTTITIKAAGVPGTTRISATVDGDGNRSALTLSPPA